MKKGQTGKTQIGGLCVLVELQEQPGSSIFIISHRVRRVYGIQLIVEEAGEVSLQTEGLCGEQPQATVTWEKKVVDDMFCTCCKHSYSDQEKALPFQCI